MNAPTAHLVNPMSLRTRLRSFFLGRRACHQGSSTACLASAPPLPPPPPPRHPNRERERHILREARRLRESAAALDDLLQESAFDAWLAEREG